jgi:hypothetical protein
MLNMTNLKTLSLASLALLTMLLVPSETKADPFTLTSGGPSVAVLYQTTFANSHAQAIFSLNGNQLTVVLTNTSTANTKLFAFGFDSSPDLTLSAGPGNPNITYAAGTVADFQIDSQGLQHEIGANADGGNLGAVLNAGESLTVVFTFTTPLSSLTIDLTRIHMGDVGGINDLSEKPVGVPNQVIPEPASLLLLGTGLMGVVAGFRRRGGAAK